MGKILPEDERWGNETGRGEAGTLTGIRSGADIFVFWRSIAKLLGNITNIVHRSRIAINTCMLTCTRPVITVLRCSYLKNVLKRR